MKRAIAHLRQGDPLLGALIDRVGGYKMDYGEPTFPSLARSIVYQQLNGRAAATIYGRFENACGEGGVVPERVLRIRAARMRSVGLSAQKASYIRDLARRTRDGELDFAALPGMTDAEVIECLTAVKGIGEWTAHMFLMFALRRPDVLPTGDFGIRNAMRLLYSLPEMPKPAEMQKIATPWRPWASVACWYLWRSLDTP